MATSSLRRFQLTGVSDTGRTIGDGSYATVKELEFHGLKCVGKKIHQLLFDAAKPHEREAMLQRFAEECELLSNLHHPCIVQFLGVYFEQGSQLPVLVMECLHTTLSDCLAKYGVLSEAISYAILHDVALGLRYLHEHSPPIIHRDLSANNVLLTSSMSGKISDLGVAKILNITPAQMTQMMSTQAPGTPCYMPPEALMAKPTYTSKIDSYSYGVMIIHVLCGRWPFPTDVFHPDPHNPVMMVPVLELDRRAEYLQDISQDHPLMGLIRQCLSNAPTYRPEASEILRQITTVVARVPETHQNKIEMLQHWKTETQTLRSQNETLMAQNQDQQSQIESLTAQNQDQQSQIESLTAQNQDQQSQIESLTAQTRAEHSQVETLRAEPEQLSGRRPQREKSARFSQPPQLAHPQPHLPVDLHVQSQESEALVSKLQNPPDKHESEALIKLHNPPDKHTLQTLLRRGGVDVNTIDPQLNLAPIHSIVKRGRPDRQELLLTLLNNSDVNVDLKTPEGNTPLHLAVEEDDINCVQALIAFDADVNAQNDEGKTSVDLAIIIGRKKYVKHTFSQEYPLEEPWESVSVDPDGHDYHSLSMYSEMVRLLKSVGAIQSKTITANHQPPSIASEMLSPEPTPVNHELYEENERSRCLYKDLEDYINERWADTTSPHNVDEMVAMGKQKKEIERYKKTGSRILCLDGGGMKGLVEIEILSQIEQATGKRITELFDWIVATSTGAVIALGLVYAKASLKEVRQLYFGLKEKVFANSNFGLGFNTEAFERLLLELPGTKMRMSEVKSPKVLIAAVNKSVTPLQLHFFNNCFDNEFSNEFVWKVARYTSAAPLIFSELDNYVDGGVIANNPSEYGLMEIQNFHLQQGQKLPISLIVSVGSGVYPEERLGSINAHEYLFGPRIMKTVNVFGNLLQLLSNALVESELVARTFGSHCAEQGIPYYRLSPQLDEVIPAAETDDKKLLKMIIAAKARVRGDILELTKKFM